GSAPQLHVQLLWLYQLLRGDLLLGFRLAAGRKGCLNLSVTGPKLLRETARLSLYRQAGGRASAQRKRSPAKALRGCRPRRKVSMGASRTASGNDRGHRFRAPLDRYPARILNSQRSPAAIGALTTGDTLFKCPRLSAFFSDPPAARGIC